MPADVKIHNPEGMAKPTVGYSHVAEVRSGKVVYISGQVAQDENGDLVGQNDFEAQVKQVFANLDTAVKAAGGTFANVVKLNIYCVDRVERSQLPLMRRIRDQYVDTALPPASTLVFVRDLVHPDWLIEIEAVAAVSF